MSPMFRLKATLDHLAIVSWRVQAAKLATLLPEPLVPQTIDAEGQWGLVSMAMMFDTTHSSRYEQVNERAYVKKRDGSGEGAFFWRSHANSPQASFYRFLLGVPEYEASLSLNVKSDSYVFSRESHEVARLVLKPPTGASKKYQKFDLERAKRVSQNPLIGYTMNWGELCETLVYHDKIDAGVVTTVAADPSFMLPSVAIERDELGRPEDPLIAVYQRDTPFIIGLPPRPVRGGSYLGLWRKAFCPWSASRPT